MAQYTPAERFVIVELYIENRKSIVLTQRKFRAKFPRRKAPDPRTIRDLYKKISSTGSLHNVPCPIKPRRARSNTNITIAQDLLEEDPNLSTRRGAQALGISRMSMQRILHIDLELFPYKIQMVQQLKPEDYPRRLEYGKMMKNLERSEDDFWNKIIMSDEAHFDLNGNVNKQTCRFWADKNPEQYREKPLHDKRVTVWAGICSDCIIGPFFFENDDGEAISVNGDRYRAMVDTFLREGVENNGLEDHWFQQDGATAHTARATIDLLNEMFPGRLVSKNGDFEWPPRSPDLTPPDFFLWGYLKGKVYADRPKTLTALKRNIEREIAAITTETLKKVMENAKKRSQLCIKEKGKHLRDIIFH
jgi:hypothetical protein